MDANKTGKIIKDARIAKNMTQKELADQISPSVLLRYPNGRMEEECRISLICSQLLLPWMLV